jgi:outer membrane receptor protein involved in Fe transport
MQARLSYGGTVARPQIRELVPYLFADFARQRTIQGNPLIGRTFIHNLDLRWEWFFGNEDVLAATVFYKYFRDPIEQVVLDRNGNITFENVDAAQNVGGEVEARMSFGRFHRSLDWLSMGANLTLVYSRVRLNDEQRASATSAERPLAGQSPYVANLSLGFSPGDTGVTAALYYNVFGRRIVDVGRLGLPDTYEQPFHSLDLMISYEPIEHLQLRFTARNLLYRSVVLEQGGIEVRRYRPGISLGIKLSYSY